MPHYDYLCEACGVTTEVFHGINEKALTVCDQCGGKLKRLIGGGAGVIFKGTGFYKTDYSNKPGCSDSGTANPSCANCEAGKKA